jgi:integrase
MAGRRKANGEGTVFQRIDGRWCGAGYVLTADGTPKRVFVYGETRKEANDKLTAKLADSNRGLTVAADTTTTVGVYLTGWLETVAVHRLRPTTYDTYDSLIRRYLIPGLGGRKLASLTVSEVQTFLDRLPTICQCCAWGWDAKKDPNHRVKARRPRCCAIGNCCNKTVKPATVNYIRAVLSAALSHAVRTDVLARNVATAVRLPTPRSDFQPFTAAEARKYLSVAAFHRHGPLYELALRTGLRRGELLALHWDDIDLDAGHLYVTGTMARVKGGAKILPTKTYRSARRIVLPRECVTSLHQYRKRQDIDRREAEDRWRETGLVFVSAGGTTLDMATVHRNHQLICELADLRYIRLHDLRHTCASLLLEQGVDLVTIKDLLGHAQIHTTADIYSHVRPRTKRKAIESVGDALQSTPDSHACDDDDEEPDDPPLAVILTR